MSDLNHSVLLLLSHISLPFTYLCSIISLCAVILRSSIFRLRSSSGELCKSCYFVLFLLFQNDHWYICLYDKLLIYLNIPVIYWLSSRSALFEYWLMCLIPVSYGLQTYISVLSLLWNLNWYADNTWGTLTQYLYSGRLMNIQIE
jgi:hypothetical protein